MSSSAYLYLINNDKATVLYSGSGSSRFYDLLDDAGAPFKKIAPLSMTKINNILGRLETDCASYREQIEEAKEMITTIVAMPDDISTRLEKIGEFRGYIAESKEELEDTLYWKSVFTFLLNVLENIKNNIKYCGVEDQIWLGMGIESGIKPTKEDFVLPPNFNSYTEEESES